jgi:hypothetical protein
VQNSRADLFRSSGQAVVLSWSPADAVILQR